VLNQAAVEAFGWTNAEALSKELLSSDERPNWSVIGVTEDFHYQSMRQEVQPLALLIQNAVGDPARPSSIFARLAAGRTSETVERLRSTWTEAAPQAAFQYAFLDQTYDRLHRDVQRAGTLFGVLAGLALVIACLGLFGLATYTVQRRSKEIGIRKALGATATQVVLMLSRQFLILVAVAGAVGLPVAYYAMQQWLQNFAYRITPGVGLLTVGLVGTIVIAFIAISYQALRAARLNPATTLRDE
jgi:putative ABC transport system permease protein